MATRHGTRSQETLFSSCLVLILNCPGPLSNFIFLIDSLVTGRCRSHPVFNFCFQFHRLHWCDKVGKCCQNEYMKTQCHRTSIVWCLLHILISVTMTMLTACKAVLVFCYLLRKCENLYSRLLIKVDKLVLIVGRKFNL
jgi:hypothetical protein